jgi:hypothetical protein
MLQFLFQRASLNAAGTRTLTTIAVLAILGCATPAIGQGGADASANGAGSVPAQAPAPDGDAAPDVNLSGALLYQLMAAEVAAQRGEIGTAYATYMKLARDTRDPRLARRATELGLQGRALAETLEAAKLWHELAPRSNEAGQTLAMLYAASGKFEESYALFSEQLKAGPSLRRNSHASSAR